jgi:putative ABC transport system permease protein
MTRVALGDLRAHPVRLLATALSVVLGTAFVAGTFILTDMARAGFDHLFAAGGAHADVVVRPVGDLEGQVRGRGRARSGG